MIHKALYKISREQAMKINKTEPISSKGKIKRNNSKLINIKAMSRELIKERI
jgi:hypothetical protein